MYDDKTYDRILEEMLDRVSSDVSKGEGTLINFALEPAAAEFEEAYLALDVVDQNGSALTCDREHLIQFGNENNIPIKTATYAVWLACFNTDFEIGERFCAGELTYISTVKVDAGKYWLQCETAGMEGNQKPDDELTPIEFINNYESGELVELVEEAVDDEDTEAYRSRYLSERKIDTVMTGNRAAYKKAIKASTGVGGVKLYRVTAIKKRIEAFVLSSSYGVPDSSVINAVQQLIDPIGQQGDGAGQAPFFHVVDIKPCQTLTVNVTANVTIANGTTWEIILEPMRQAVDDYFIELIKTWEYEDRLIVRVLKVAEAMASVSGVIDVEDLTLNDASENLILDQNAIPVRGEIVNVN